MAKNSAVDPAQRWDHPYARDVWDIGGIKKKGKEGTGAVEPDQVGRISLCDIRDALLDISDTLKLQNQMIQQLFGWKDEDNT